MIDTKKIILAIGLLTILLSLGTRLDSQNLKSQHILELQT